MIYQRIKEKRFNKIGQGVGWAYDIQMIVMVFERIPQPLIVAR